MKTPHADFLIFDIETLSTRENATVLCISMLCGKWTDYFDYTLDDDVGHTDLDMKNIFDSLCEDTFTFRIDSTPKEQAELYGRHIDPDTVKWWMGNKEAMERVKSIHEEVIPEDVYGEFAKYLEENDYHEKRTRVYIRAPHFDDTIMRSYWREANGYSDGRAPYNHWSIRDIRSIVDTAFGTWYGYPEREEKEALIDLLGVVKHDPEHDIAFDMMLLYLSAEMDRTLSQRFNR